MSNAQWESVPPQDKNGKKALERTTTKLAVGRIPNKTWFTTVFIDRELPILFISFVATNDKYYTITRVLASTALLMHYHVRTAGPCLPDWEYIGREILPLEVARGTLSPTDALRPLAPGGSWKDPRGAQP